MHSVYSGGVRQADGLYRHVCKQDREHTRSGNRCLFAEMRSSRPPVYTVPPVNKYLSIEEGFAKLAEKTREFVLCYDPPLNPFRLTGLVYCLLAKFIFVAQAFMVLV